MRTAAIGTLTVPVVGLGCNNFGRALDADGSRRVVDAAFDHGATFFDTAANYGNGQSEAFLGAALEGRRDDAIVATKFGMPRPDEPIGGAHPDYIRSSARRSLTDLRTGVIDLFQLHKPDPDVPIAETLGALWDLVDEGLVREIGCSNLDKDQLAEALEEARRAGRPGFMSNQVHYSLVYPEPEQNGLAEVAVAEGVALLPYYPLANGLLTGKLRRGDTPEGRLKMDRYERFLADRNFSVAEATVSFAEARSMTAVQAAIGWLLSRPAVPAVTPGATKAEQVAANAAAAGLGEVDFGELDRVVASL